MSITDELREYADEHECDSYRKLLLAIADRIDIAHKHAIGYVDDRDPETMAENGWVRLPKDADGEYIHIGDRMENNERVARIVLTDESWEPSVYVEKLPNVLHEYFCNEISHYRAPTVEDVLREFAEKITDSQIPNVHPTYEEAIAEYASKLRLAGENV